MDPLAEDSLGKLALTREGLRERNRLVLEACMGVCPVVLTQGGGYSSTPTASVQAHIDVVTLACHLSHPVGSLPWRDAYPIADDHPLWPLHTP